MPNVEWLLREAAGEVPLEVSEYTRIDDDRWHALIERLELGPGLRVFLVDADVRRPIAVEPTDNERDPWLGIGVAVAGRVRLSFTDGLTTRIAPDRAALFRPKERRLRFFVPGGQTLRYPSCGLRADRIERVFEGGVPAVLRPLLEQKMEASHSIPLASTRALRGLADGLFARGFNGPLRLLYIEGAVLQLLAASAKAANAPLHRSGTALTAQERDAIHEARERLLADMRRPPGLGELAAAVGLSERRLNAGFRTLFGGTVFQTLRNERLEHARIVIESGEVETLKQVAYRVGYNHVTNFINAFTSRYGAPPRHYGKASRSPGPCTALPPARVGKPSLR